MTFDIDSYNRARLQSMVHAQAGHFDAVVSTLRPWLDHLCALSADNAAMLGLDLARALYFTNDVSAASSLLGRLRELIDQNLNHIPALADIHCRLLKIQVAARQHHHDVVLQEAALALETLRRLGNPNPSYAETLWFKGISLSELSRDADALTTYEQALSALPASSAPGDLSNPLVQLIFKVRNSRCVSLAKLGRTQEALADLEEQIRGYEEAYRNRPDPSLLSQLASKYGNQANLLIRAGNFRAAAASIDCNLQTLINAAPGNAVAQAKIDAVRHQLTPMRTAATSYSNLLEKAERGEAPAQLAVGLLCGAASDRSLQDPAGGGGRAAPAHESRRRAATTGVFHRLTGLRRDQGILNAVSQPERHFRTR